MSQTPPLNNYIFDLEVSGSGEPLLLIHGSASDRRTWQHQTNIFSESFRVISYSRRYHYPNEKIAENEDYSMQQHVEDLQALIKYLGDESVHIIGHSYGALMGLELATQQPQLIRRMVLAEPPAIRLYVSNVPKPVEILKLFLRKPRTALAIVKLGVTGFAPATMAAKKGDMPEVMRRFGKAALGEDTFNNITDERKEQVLVNLTASEFTGSGYLPLEEETLKNITIPTLLVTGENSPAVFRYLKDGLQELLPNTQHHEISQASHIMHEDNPTEFNETVLAFLTKKDLL